MTSKSLRAVTVSRPALSKSPYSVIFNSKTWQEWCQMQCSLMNEDAKRDMRARVVYETMKVESKDGTGSKIEFCHIEAICE